MIIPRRKAIPFLRHKAEQVVVIDEPNINLPGRRRRYLRRILGINPRLVGLDSLQPLPRPLLAPLGPHRRHHRLERGVGRRPADAPPPLGVGKAKHIIRQIGLRQPLRIIYHRPRPPGNAHPFALGRPGPLRRPLQNAGRQRREHPLDRAQSTRVLGKENIRRRIAPFLQQRRRQLSRPGVLHLHINPGDRSELLNDVIHQRLAAPGVDDQLPRVRRPFHHHIPGNFPHYFLRHQHLSGHFPHHLSLHHHIHRHLPHHFLLDHHLPGNLYHYLLFHHHLFLHHLRLSRRRAASQHRQQPHRQQGQPQVPVKPSNPRHR